MVGRVWKGILSDDVLKGISERNLERGSEYDSGRGTTMNGLKRKNTHYTVQ